MARPKMMYFIEGDDYYAISPEGWQKIVNYVNEHRKVPDNFDVLYGARQLTWIPKNRTHLPILDCPIIPGASDN